MLPPGMILVEKSLNNKACGGFRVMDMRENMSKDFIQLVDVFLPVDPKATKANTSQSWLIKIVNTMKTASAESASLTLAMTLFASIRINRNLICWNKVRSRFMNPDWMTCWPATLQLDVCHFRAT